MLIGVLAAVLVPTALAAPGDPQKKLTKAGQARARTAALRLSDFGAGWKAERSPNDNTNPRCSSYNPDQSDLVEIGDYDSPDFTRTDGSFVSSSTGVFKTAAMARTAYSRVVKPALPTCFAELFRKGTGNPNAVTILGSGPLQFPHFGDRSAAYRLSATFAVQGQKVGLTIDIVIFNRGQMDVATIFLGIGRPLPASFERSLMGRLAARAAA